jgi:hypothetical protein
LIQFRSIYLGDDVSVQEEAAEAKTADKPFRVKDAPNPFVLRADTHQGSPSVNHACILGMFANMVSFFWTGKKVFMYVFCWKTGRQVFLLEEEEEMREEEEMEEDEKEGKLQKENVFWPTVNNAHTHAMCIYY